MQDALNPPAQVEDDLPTLRTELGEWWEKHLKPLIDFKSFLRQRRAILQNHDLAHCAHPPYDGWKNPFAFALSASTLTFTVLALIGIAFHTLFPDPDLKNDWIAHDLQAQLNSSVSTPQAREQIMADLNDHLSGLTVPHEGIVLTAGIPLVVYFLGVFFPRFVARKARSAPYASSAREIVYYYFTARTFWPVFLLVTSGAIYFFLMKYSLLNTYDELHETFPVHDGPLFLFLGAIATLGAVPFCYAIFATPVAFHKCARDISAVLGIKDDAAAKRVIYWGLISALAVSSFLAFTLTVLLVSGYTLIDSGAQTMRTALGTSLSTAPATQQTSPATQ